MDARFIPALTLLLGLAICSHGKAIQGSYTVESANFRVTSVDPRLAEMVALKAEEYRRELAIQWLGRELPAWNQKCPIKVFVEPQAWGQTSFAFSGQPGSSLPSQWDMSVHGSPDRILDSVLPHEVTHTIFATHFRQPLPRWADEGACTSVEHLSERNKIDNLLQKYLRSRPSQGIPFNRMFVMRDYPEDPNAMLPLYAQAYSLARFLILQGGEKVFIRFVEQGLSNESQMNPLRAWDSAVKSTYGYNDLSDLQVQWVTWVAADMPPIKRDPSVILASGSVPSPASVEINSANWTADPVPVPETSDVVLTNRLNALPEDSWYRQQLLQSVNRQSPGVEGANPITSHSFTHSPEKRTGSTGFSSGSVWR